MCAYGVNVGPGDSTLLGCRIVTRLGDPVGVIEKTVRQGSTVAVQGWAYDYDTPTQSIKVVAYLNGAIAGYGPTAVSRPDVNATFKITGIHGYSIPLHLRAGINKICTSGSNIGPGSHSTLGCRLVHQ
jgi:hypothetical protein